MNPRSRLAAFGARRRRVDHQPGRLDLHRHVGQHELHTLELADALVKLLALLGICDRSVQCALRDAHRLRADGRAGVVQRRQRGLEPGAGLADDPVAGDAAVLEVQLRGGRALDAELALLRPDREALVVLVHHERRDAVGALLGIGRRHHRVPGRLAAVGDPRLAAVENPRVAVRPRPGAHRGRVAAGLALGQCIRRHRLTGGYSTAAPASSNPRSRTGSGPSCRAC